MQHFNWKRFWHLRGQSCSLENGAFLSTQAAESETVVGFEKIAKLPCVILLGEPGTGKSTSIGEAVGAVASNEAHYVNLNSYGDEKRLIEDVFQAESVTKWKTSDHSLYLFLDSLDECRLQLPHVLKVIDQQLAQFKPYVSRLRLRIGCRTADWPIAFEQKLESLWGMKPSVYELAPLTRRDVEHAVFTSELDASSFFTELERVSAYPFAAKPLTLDLLIQLFRERGQLPSSQIELYEHGCKLLCQERNPDRIIARQGNGYTTEQRFCIAKAIAACVIFCAKSGIEANESSRNVLDSSDLTFCDLIGINLEFNGEVLSISKEALIETIGTGLFCGQGPNRVRFVHQTFAEFLAASFLVESRMDGTQKRHLLHESVTGKQLVFPQLAECAAWASSMDQTVFQLLLDYEPKILLKTDVACLSDHQRSLIVQRFLEQFAHEDSIEDPWSDFPFYGKLRHSGLAEQIAPYITDASKNESSRRFAVHLALFNEQRELVDDLISTRMKDSESESIVEACLDAAVRLANISQVSSLLPLAQRIATSRSHFRIKQRVLSALWPGHISAKELFECIQPTNNDESGLYRGFVQFALARELQSNDLTIALEWAASMNGVDRFDRGIEALISQIAVRAWNECDQKLIRQAFCKFAVNRLLRRVEVVPLLEGDGEKEAIPKPADNPVLRHEVTRYVVHNMEKFEAYADGLVHFSPQLVRHADLAWLIECMNSESDEEHQERWLTLIEDVFDSNDPAHFELILDASDTSPKLAECFCEILEPVELGSDRAREMKRRFERWQVMEAGSRTEELQQNTVPIAERVLPLLVRSEGGETAVWRDILDHLDFAPDGPNYPWSLRNDPTQMPGWRSLDSQLQERIVESAKRFIDDDRFESGLDWVGTGSMPGDPLNGYHAIHLVASLDPHGLKAISPEAWQRWASIIIWMQDFTQVTVHDFGAKIAFECAEQAPSVIQSCLQRMTRKRQTSTSSQTPDIFVLSRFFEFAWQPAVERMLAASLMDPTIDDLVFRRIAVACLEHNSSLAKKHVKAAIPTDIPSSGPERSRAITAAGALIEAADDGAWGAVWPAIQIDVAFGKAAIESVAEYNRMNPSIVYRIGAAASAELYIWMASVYTFRSHRDPVDGPHEPTHGALEYRDSILRAIQGLGTEESVRALKRIATHFPDQSFLLRVVTSARYILARQRWTPISPAALFEIAKDPKRRIIQTASQLQDVIVESLRRLDGKLQGENPAVEDLWNANVPKDENCLSDYIVRHLRDDLVGRGVVALREVEIRRGGNSIGRDGERTDIYITREIPDAKFGSSTIAQVILEVKCIWNPSLKTAMKEQLVDRYLQDNDCRHGLYVVGWYDGIRWKKETSSYRKSRSVKSLADLQSQLEEQVVSITEQHPDISLKIYVLQCAIA